MEHAIVSTLDARGKLSHEDISMNRRSAFELVKQDSFKENLEFEESSPAHIQLK